MSDDIRNDRVDDEAFQRANALARGLFPHQVEGLAFLLGRRRAILADDMGLGKTRTSIVAAREAAPGGPYLVVCPASVKQNWAREIALVDPDATTRVVSGSDDIGVHGLSDWTVVNYDILPKQIAALEKVNWTAIVFDEAHCLLSRN